MVFLLIRSTTPSPPPTPVHHFLVDNALRLLLVAARRSDLRFMPMVPAKLNMLLFRVFPRILELCTACSTNFLPLLPPRALAISASMPNIMSNEMRIPVLLILLHQAPHQTRVLQLTAPPLTLSLDAPPLEAVAMLAWSSTLISPFLVASLLLRFHNTNAVGH